MKTKGKRGQDLPRNGFAQAAKARKAEPMRHRTDRRSKERNTWMREWE